jgi:chloride channel 3/4/5
MALISVVTLQIIDPYRGKEVLYQVEYTRSWLSFEIVFFIIIGAFGVVFGLIIGIDRSFFY